MADESVVVKMVRTTQPDWSEGTLLYLKSFFGGEVGKNDKNFHKPTGTEGKDMTLLIKSLQTKLIYHIQSRLVCVALYMV